MSLLMSVIYVIAIGIVAHYIGESIPANCFHYNRFPYRTWRWEYDGKIYDRLQIRKWKDALPDMSRVMRDMVPKRLGKCPTSALAWRLVRETCRAEIVHIGLCMCAPVIYFFWWNRIGVCLALLTVLGNLPFILIQRYNRPTLVRLAERLEIREERKRCEY